MAGYHKSIFVATRQCGQTSLEMSTACLVSRKCYSFLALCSYRHVQLLVLVLALYICFQRIKWWWRWWWWWWWRWLCSVWM